MKPATNQTSSDLFDLLDEWKVLTLAECESILAEDWVRLEQLQSQKTASQPVIEASHTALLQRAPRSQRTEIENRLIDRSQELLKLESRNRQLLAEKLAQTDSELKQNDKTTRSIRQVQRAYGAADRSFWQSYS